MGVTLLEVLVAVMLSGLAIVGYLQLAWWVLRGQHQMLWQQRARLMLLSLHENVGAEKWLSRQVSVNLPQGTIGLDRDRWQIRWSGGRVETK